MQLQNVCGMSSITKGERRKTHLVKKQQRLAVHQEKRGLSANRAKGDVSGNEFLKMVHHPD